MTELFEILLIIAAFFIGRNSFGKEKEKPEIRKEEKPPEDIFFLRNGFSVTRDKNPTVAEQLVNIMNYSGENQREEFYEETEGNFPGNDLG